MNRSIVKDLYRYEGPKAYNRLVQLKYKFFVPGFTYIYYFRKTQLAKSLIERFFYLAVLRVTSYITHIQIPYQTRIGDGFRILHFGTIVINPDAVIGRNFNISQGCLIGHSQGKRGVFLLLVIMSV